MKEINKKTNFNITANMAHIIFIAILFFCCSFFNCNNAKAAPIDVAGWAWSENIGWISFNDLNCDVDGDETYEGGGEGGGATPAPAGCPIAGAVIPYGVDLDSFSGDLSGYAWSNNIGWISFEPADIVGCPGVCQPNLAGGVFSGWARALSNGGGWDGWISLNCANSGGCAVSNYSVSLNASNDFEGWAWGDSVVGWISFNCTNEGSCATSDYKVYLANTPPTVTPISITYTDYCIFDLPGGISLSWTFSDNEDAAQTGYKIDFLRDGAVPCTVLKNPDPALSIIGSDINASCGAGFIDYGNHTYIWDIEVYDSAGASSGPVTGEAFPNPTAGVPEPTPIHRWPTADFSYSAADDPPLQFQEITFDPLTFPDDSVCYDINNVSTPCLDFKWDFESDTIIDEITLPASPNATHFYSEIGTFDVDLKVTDPDGNFCHTSQPLTIGISRPDWNETIP